MSDTERFAGAMPNAARMYDYFLGGKDHREIDRQAADALTARLPEVPLIARQNRAFLGRVVRHLAAEHGYRQFLDIGSGLPTRDNVHEVAQAVDPACRVVYVDHDPIVVDHARSLLGTRHGDRVGVLRYDVLDMPELLADAELHRVLDLSRPTAVLMVAVLHFLPQPVPEIRERVIAPLAAALQPGSHMVISHGVANDPATIAEAARHNASSSADRNPARTPGDVAAMVASPWRLVEPGVVAVQDWDGIGPLDDVSAPAGTPTPDGGGGAAWVCAAVARLQPG